MIEFQLFKRDNKDDFHVLKILINGSMVFSDELCRTKHLHRLRDGLKDELHWLEDYLTKGNAKGLE